MWLLSRPSCQPPFSFFSFLLAACCRFVFMLTGYDLCRLQPDDEQLRALCQVVLHRLAGECASQAFVILSACLSSETFHCGHGFCFRAEPGAPLQWSRQVEAMEGVGAVVAVGMSSACGAICRSLTACIGLP